MKLIALLPLAMLAACGGEAPAPDATDTAAANSAATAAPADPLAIPGKLRPQVADFPALQSRSCMDVVGFYSDALAAGEYDNAALAWADPVIDGARLQALFNGYGRPALQWDEPTEEGAAGSLYCTITGTLTDAANPGTAPRTGTLTLRRVNDVDGASAQQLRWTIRSSTFIEPLERSGTGSPA